MKPFSVDFARGYNGQGRQIWVCRVWFRMATTEQCTDQTHQGHGGSHWWPLAYWRAWRAAKALHAQLAARPGGREAVGWAP